MSASVVLVHCPEARIYDLGPQHPLRPERVLLTWELIEATGLDRAPNVRRIGCDPATDEQIALVHSREFIDATRRAGNGERGPWGRFGYGPGDNPVFPRMHEAGALVVGASVAAADEVLSGRAEHSFNAAGGLHHAMRDRASGFCVYNDAAAAIARLLAEGADRVAYVDVDVHHGDGPQAIFYTDPRVLTISIHESGEFLFPGTGFVEESGSGEAAWTKVNVPLGPGTGDGGWLAAFRAIVPPLVEAWKPDVLVTQLGCDTHETDPLAHFRLTTRAYRETARILHDLAHSAAGGRWVAVGGGGYQWARVVPRAWTIYFSAMAAFEIPDELPEAWVRKASSAARGAVPATLSDPAGPGDEPDEAAERVIGRVREAFFPRYGL